MGWFSTAFNKKECLEFANKKIEDVDIIAINSRPNSNLTKKIWYSISHIDTLSHSFERLLAKKEIKPLAWYFDKYFPKKKIKAKVIRVDHHMAHVASAFFSSDFKKSIVLTIDGFGDFASTSWCLAENDKISKLKKIFYPHSLGIFYEAMTHYLGFKDYGDEYKVMGLAPYGTNTYKNEFNKIITLYPDGSFKLNLDYFSHHKGKGKHIWNDGIPRSEDCFSNKIIELFGKPRNPDELITQKHKDIANGIQNKYEEAFFNLLNKLHSDYPSENLCLAGGCAMNSVANGKILKQTKFKNIHVQPAAGDAGGSLGAAYYAWHKLGGKTHYNSNQAYLGPSFKNIDFERLILENETKLINQKCKFHLTKSSDELCELVTKKLINGGVVGWFQDKMEWGPRALGNRSILCDPRRPDAQSILNKKIKRRESFRPFAPSILRESVSEWFEYDHDVPYMSQVFPIKKDKRDLIPAVTHVDGTGRLQTVTSSLNSLYYELIRKFYLYTNVPMLLNTSFNENEPIVCKPKEALDCFLRTKMDLLALGNWVIYRSPYDI